MHRASSCLIKGQDILGGMFDSRATVEKIQDEPGVSCDEVRKCFSSAHKYISWYGRVERLVGGDLGGSLGGQRRKLGSISEWKWKKIQLKEKWEWLSKTNCASFIILLQVYTLGNELLLPVTTWKNLINIVLNEKRHLQEEMYEEILKKAKLIYGVRSQKSG